MHEPSDMRRGQGAGGFPDDAPSLGSRRPLPRRKGIGEGLAVDELHDEVGGAGSRQEAHLVDADHVGVPHGGGGLRLALESQPDRLDLGELRVQDLDGHRTSQGRVSAEVHRPHPAGPKFADDLDDRSERFLQLDEQNVGQLRSRSTLLTVRGGGRRRASRRALRAEQVGCVVARAAAVTTDNVGHTHLVDDAGGGVRPSATTPRRG